MLSLSLSTHLFSLCYQGRAQHRYEEAPCFLAYTHLFSLYYQGRAQHRYEEALLHQVQELQLHPRRGHLYHSAAELQAGQHQVQPGDILQQRGAD